MSDYNAQIAAGLERAYKQHSERASFDVASDKWVIFSDLHRGARDGADDFAQCERAYNAALGYYYERGYTLLLLGDAEELWECSPKNVLKAYAWSLKLESDFHRAGRYRRFFGNHDSDWQRNGAVRKYLHPIFGDDLKVSEALRVNVYAAGMPLGQIFLVHGHQGTIDADKYSFISRLAVRYGWAFLQRLAGRLGISLKSTTPAQDFELRQKHNIAMYRWAVGKEGTIVIAGHTHRPVFKSKNKLALLEDELKAARAGGDVAMIAEKRAELEAARVQEFGGASGEVAIEEERPCYFNTGCCSFSDGDVTAIEIADGRIRLLRWPDDEGQPSPRDLAAAELREVFAASTAARPMSPVAAVP